MNPGFRIVPGVFGAREVAGLVAALETAKMDRATRGIDTFGARNLLGVPAICALAASPALRDILEPEIGPDFLAVRGLFFDKTPGANWPVAWHQDLTLAVSVKRDIDGWTNWSTKAGVHHVQPPVAVLERMATLRVMLDDCGPDNGPLRVVAGSHALGRLSRARIAALTARAEDCCCEAGAVMMMRPLLLHASSAARAPRHRRVVQIEYAARDAVPADLVA
jgi:ectoine hydroxylase-related dioxygenase (phytanoyl-CoA dioxygenase family)